MDKAPSPVVALDIGGTHVTAALVDADRREVIDGSSRHRSLRPDGSAREILDPIIDCAADTMAGVPQVDETCGVAIPGPFEYDTGIGRFAGVAKFEALAGVDVRAALLEGLAPALTRMRFVNDADAFTLGEWLAGAARGHDRLVGITIGSGIGSTFLDHGHVIETGPDVPPTGRAYLITIDGEPLEERVSRRALIRAAAGHPALRSAPGADVRELADAARSGDEAAAGIFHDAFSALGRALGPWLARFGATILVVGGSIARSWDLVVPALLGGLRDGDQPWNGPVEQARLGDEASLIGAAILPDEHVADPSSHPPKGHR